MNDLRFGLRILAKSRGSTAFIVLLLALGMGASTTIFSLFDAVLLRPLGVRHPEQLVRMVQRLPKPLGIRSQFAYAYYKALCDRSKTLGPVFAETVWQDHFRMTEPAPAEGITVRGVTPEFFKALDVPPLLGRFLSADDATRHFDTPPAVLSYNFWHKKFAGNDGSLQKQILAIDGHRFLIVGTMPKGFQGLSVDNGPDIWIPIQAYSLLVPEFRLDDADFTLAGRLKPSATAALAQAECLTIWHSAMADYYRNIEKLPPEAASRLLQRGVEIQSLERGTSVLRDNYGDVLNLVMAAVTLLALMVALNVAGLLLAKGATREQEMAVRLAIGASHWRLARQLFAEGILLAALAGVAAFVVTLIVTPVAVRSLPPVRDLYTAVVPISLDAGFNWRVLSFLIALSAVTTIAFVLTPALTSWRLSIDRVLRGARSSSSLRGRQVLIAAQIALCTCLLASAGLLVRSFERLRATPSGFAIDSIATFRCDAGAAKYPAGAVDSLMEKLREIPGVISAATSSSGVLRGHGLFMTAAPTGQKITHADFMDSNANEVSRDYFNTMGLHVLAGRDFRPGDAPRPNQTAPVKAVVNESFVRRLFPTSSGIGKRFGTGMEGSIASAGYEIIGVISDAKYRSLRDPMRPMVYSLQNGLDGDFMLNVRAGARPQTIIEPVRQRLASAAPDLLLLETGTLERAADEITAPERTTATLVSFFGGMAALLAGVGTYGLLAYSVTQRRREIGIRMALGAQRSHVARLIAGQTLTMALTGIAIGLCETFVAGPVIRSMLYGISPQDPVTLAVACIFVLLVAMGATAGPIADAVQTPAAETLRAEA